MPYKDVQKRRDAVNRHYRNNKEYYKAKAKKAKASQRLSLRKLIFDFKAVPCMDCGQRYPTYVMQFDHVSGNKEFDIANAVSNGLSTKKVIEEINKCEIVCANCHSIRTHKRIMKNKTAHTQIEEIFQNALPRQFAGTRV